MKKVAKVSTIKPNPTLFNHRGVGRKGYKPLKHKDGTPFTDIEYFELLNERVKEIEKEQAGNTFINYEEYGFDRDTVEIAKQVGKALDEKRPEKEIRDFLGACIDFNK